MASSSQATSASVVAALEAGGQVDIGLVAAEYRTLRDVRGHFSSEQGEWNKEVDSFGGSKRKLMEVLGTTLGVPGTPVSAVLSQLGPPDRTTPAIDKHSIGDNDDEEEEGVDAGDGSAIAQQPPTFVPLQPGPFIPTSSASGAPSVTFSAAASKPFYLIYEWRGNHDYLWFKVRVTPGGEESVQKSGWYMAGD